MAKDKDATGATSGDDSLIELRKLIELTAALSETEKLYWLDLLPTMNDRQVQQLRQIVESEHKNVEELATSEAKAARVWDAEEAKSLRLKRREKEKEHQKETDRKAEKLLEEW